MATIALIFAGGSGSRMNSHARPKQFLQFYGKELIIHTVENFQNHPDIDGIVIACIEDWIPYLQKLLVKYEIDKVRAVVAGGETGQESIYKGLCAIHEYAPADSVVLVHDGVRPFVNEQLISIVTTTNGKITSITDRSKCYHAKAPQCFILGELFEAHKKAIADHNLNMIDSASLMKHYGHELYTVQGNFDNIKITTPADFYTFKALYEVREQQQIFGL